MTTLILGVGVGLFIILSLWVLAALIFVISLRVERKVGAIAILLVSALTIILISVPRASEKPAPADSKVGNGGILSRNCTFECHAARVLRSILFGRSELRPVHSIRLRWGAARSTRRVKPIFFTIVSS